MINDIYFLCYKIRAVIIMFNSKCGELSQNISKLLL